jgi:hypothetical protein
VQRSALTEADLLTVSSEVRPGPTVLVPFRTGTHSRVLLVYCTAVRKTNEIRALRKRERGKRKRGKKQREKEWRNEESDKEILGKK